VECGCAGEKQHEKIFSLVFFISKILKNKSVNSSLPKDKKVLAGAGIPMNPLWRRAVSKWKKLSLRIVQLNF